MKKIYEVLYKVLKDSEDGTFLKGDLISFQKDGSVNNITAGGFLPAEEVEESLKGLECKIKEVCFHCKKEKNSLVKVRDEYLCLSCIENIIEKTVEKNLKNYISTEVTEDTLKNINNVLADMGIDNQITFLKSILEYSDATD